MYLKIPDATFQSQESREIFIFRVWTMSGPYGLYICMVHGHGRCLVGEEYVETVRCTLPRGHVRFVVWAVHVATRLCLNFVFGFKLEVLRCTLRRGYAQCRFLDSN